MISAVSDDLHKCPYIGQTAIVKWDAFDTSWIGERGHVIDGHFSSVVGYHRLTHEWALTVEFSNGRRRGYALSQLDLIPHE
jgi:hypothetical protein